MFRHSRNTKHRRSDVSVEFHTNLQCFMEGSEHMEEKLGSELGIKKKKDLSFDSERKLGA